MPSQPANSFTGLLVAIAIGAGCSHPGAAPPAPGEPIPADPAEQIDTLATECGGLVTALTTYRACANLDDPQRAELDAWLDHAKLSVAAGQAAHAPDGQQHEIAAACHRAIHSIRDATARCAAGPRPVVD